MTPPTQSFTPSGALACVAKIDLDRLRPKLVTELGWSDEFHTSVEDVYRKFMALHLLEPDTTHVPSGPVDCMWHAHILDTAAYADDCEVFAGRFVHHNPYYGLGGAAANSTMCAQYETTLAQFKEHFGVERTHSALATRGQNCCDKPPGWTGAYSAEQAAKHHRDRRACRVLFPKFDHRRPAQHDGS